MKIFVFLFFWQFSFSQNLSDETLCQTKFDFAVSKNLSSLPLNEIIIEIGKTFLNTKYVSNVLEIPKNESLIVNLHALDCVTFYENSYALAKTIKKEDYTFDGYLRELQNIRYRDGKILGYSSRLHYTSDYFFDNDRRKNFKIVTSEIIENKFIHKLNKKINFMTENFSLYKQMSDSINFDEISKIEKIINRREIFYIPKEFVNFAKLKSGDIIGITTSTPGIDVSHTGIILIENGITKLMHASQSNLKVELTPSSLKKYLDKNPKQTGIIVARPI